MFSFLRKPKQRFTPLEGAVLEATRAALPEELVGIFDEHLADVNLVQRYDHGREVNMYRMVKKKATFPRTKFPVGADEHVLATVTCLIEGRSKPVRSRVWVVNHNVFQIDFNAQVEKLSAQPVVKEVEITL